MLESALQATQRVLELANHAQSKNAVALRAQGFTVKYLDKQGVRTATWMRKLTRGPYSKERVKFNDAGMHTAEVTFRKHPVFYRAHCDFWSESKEPEFDGDHITYDSHGYDDNRANAPTVTLPELTSIVLPGFTTRVRSGRLSGELVIEKDGNHAGSISTGYKSFALTLRKEHAEEILRALDSATPRPPALPGHPRNAPVARKASKARSEGI